MRYLIPLFLTACAAGAPFPTGSTINPAAGCEAAGSEYVRAVTGTFTPNQFLVDNQALYVDLNSFTTCVRSDGAGAAWLFDLNGMAYGTLRVEADAVGNQPNDASTLLLDLHGATPPVSFTGDQLAGNVSVGSLTPYGVDINGTLANGTRTVILDVLATATP